MNMTVSQIGKDGTGYFMGYLSPEKLDKNGLLHDVLAWSIDVDYKREKSKLMTFLFLGGVPQNFKVLKTFNEIIDPQEAERTLKEAGLI